MNMTPKGYVFWNGGVSYTEKVIASSLAEATSKYNGEYDDYHVYDLYHVVNISEEGEKILGTYWSYDAADDAHDVYSEQYPNAFLEILYKGEVV